MAEFFNVIFAGEIAGRADPQAVRANVGRIFNASEAVLDKLFSGQPVIIKKMTDRATAMELRARMKLAGANTSMVQVDEQGRRVEAASAVVASTAVAGSMAERVDYLAAKQAQAEAARPKPSGPPPPADVARVETWAIYPLGFLLSAPMPRPAPLMPDISRISMAAAGTDMIAASERTVVKPVQVDVSGISMAAAGSDVLREEEREIVAPVVVDISGISVAPVGAPLEQIHEDKVLVNPDISHLKIV